MTEFFDSATWENIPRGCSAALYGDGRYAVPPGVAKQLGLKQARYITVTGDYRSCGIIDWERFEPDFSPVGLRKFVRGRRATSQRARVYCDRAVAREAWNALTEGSDTNLRDYAEWWISTLDGIKRTADELADDLAQAWGAPIPAGKIWAQQYEGGMTAAVDKSVLLGTW